MQKDFRLKLTVIVLVICTIVLGTGSHTYILDKYKWHTDMGEKYRLNNKHEQARQHANHAILIDSTRAEAFLLRIRINTFTDKIFAAQSDIYRLHGLTKTFQQADLNYNIGKYDEAELGFKEYVTHQPDMDAYTKLAAINLNKGDINIAEEYLIKAQQCKRPKYAANVLGTLHATKAQIYRIKGSVWKAKMEELLAWIYNPQSIQ